MVPAVNCSLHRLQAAANNTSNLRNWDYSTPALCINSSSAHLDLKAFDLNSVLMWGCRLNLTLCVFCFFNSGTRTDPEEDFHQLGQRSAGKGELRLWTLTGHLRWFGRERQWIKNESLCPYLRADGEDGWSILVHTTFLKLHSKTSLQRSPKELTQQGAVSKCVK